MQVWHALIGDILRDKFLQHRARLRAPQRQARQIQRDIADDDRAVLLPLVHPQPGDIVADEGRAGDDPESILTEAGDRQVGFHTAAGIEELGIDR